jgi:hypothetical protein
MAKGGGHFTRKMLATELQILYPSLSTHEIKLQVSGAIQDDKFANNRFKLAKPGYWDLAEKPL